mmetsp:Transcript_147338/g.473425  ORF Transcript_147338/g.473425 Transcript_147338/m.473425 type:complete len:206 (+) Transcript_147338:125-742(+)
MLSSTRWSAKALTVGKSKTSDGDIAIWKCFPNSLINWTLERLSMPASMKGLSLASSSSLAMRFLVKSMTFARTTAGSRPFGSGFARLASGAAASDVPVGPAWSATCCTASWTTGAATLLLSTMRCNSAAASASAAAATAPRSWARLRASSARARASSLRPRSKATSPCSTNVRASPSGSSAFLNHFKASSANRWASWSLFVLCSS